jgi:hypothetical protein
LETPVLGLKQPFPKIPNLQKIQNLFYSELSENYEKMTFNSNYEKCKKLVPTQKPNQMFGLKFGMQGLICCPLAPTSTGT